MTPYKRHRGSVPDPVNLGWRVKGANRDLFASLATRAGMSNAALFDAMVENIVLDDRGLPTWLPHDHKEQLPIE